MSSQPENWMKRVPDSKNPAGLSIPGTHDSMAYQIRFYQRPLSKFAKTQSNDLKTQLEDGIRFIDLRLDNTGYCYHEFIYLCNHIKDVMDVLKKFLKNHPSEAVFVSVRHERGSNLRQFCDTLIDGYMKDSKYASLWFAGTQLPKTMGEIRGKLILLRRFPLPQDRTACGVNLYDGWCDNTDSDLTTGGGMVHVQDHYNVSNNLFLHGLFYSSYVDKKFEFIKNAVELSKNNADTWFINFCSHSYNASPTVAISKIANDIEDRLLPLLTARKKGHGIFPMDFYNKTVVQTIIDAN